MSTVFENHEMCCPKCGRDESVTVEVKRNVELTPYGVDDEGGDREWDDDSPAECESGACYSGTVKDFNGREAQMAHLLRGLYEAGELAQYDLDLIAELLGDPV